MKDNYDTYVLNKKETIDYYFFAIIAVMILLYIFYNSLIFSLIISPVIASLLKKKYAEYRNNKRKDLLKSQFIELLQSLSSSISAGRQMGEALEEGLAAISSSYPLESPLIKELKFMVKSIKESREGEVPLLRSFAKRAKITDITSFVDVYSICRETGGDMEKAIGKTSQVLLEKLSIEKDMKVLSAQKKFESKLISLMPIIVIVFLRITSPSYVEPLYSTLSGRMVITLSLLGIAYAYYLTEKITRVTI